MHLLRTEAGVVSDGSAAVDLAQSPGDILFLSAADSELAALSAARGSLSADFPALRLANLLQLGHNLSVDLYLEKVASRARLIVVRLLGGAGYWPYGVEQLAALARDKKIALVFLPGDEQPDAALVAASTLGGESYHRLWRYLVEGGPENARNLLLYAASLIGREIDWAEPRPLLRAGLYWPGRDTATLDELRAEWPEPAPVAGLVFYRALLQAGDLAPIDALIAALRQQGVAALPLYCSSLKEPQAAALVSQTLAEAGAGLVLNCTAFALSSPGAERQATPFDVVDGPVLQVVLAGGSEEGWLHGTRGLSARDIAMNVALPEVDGRILSRAVSFKAEARRDPLTECAVVAHRPRRDRVDFVAELAAGWLKLRGATPAERKIALILANYPNRDGRLGNGVGLDTPAGTIEVLQALATAGYRVEEAPRDGAELIERLQEGPTNAAWRGREVSETLAMPDYQFFFGELPDAVQRAVVERWGPPERDPFYTEGELDCGRFALPAFRCGNVALAIQPARGYNIDPTASYHDPALVPPHNYLAFYAWLRRDFGAHAVVHLGKHGNLEWLPGKALALSAECYSEVTLGALPHLYPFIVNDPGEGSQAKRRAQAVIVDHLTPPLARAESYGPLADLERLVDEYYEAAGLDPRRLRLLRAEILDLARASGLDRDCGIVAEEGDESALGKLDNHLCELKELQIRDGLHIFGRSPEGEQLASLLVALLRLPRRGGKGENASLLRALAADLALGAFDPLDCKLGEPWKGSRPQALARDGAWRTNGDTVELLELLALDLVAGRREVDPAWTETRTVLAAAETMLRPAVAACGTAEIAGLLAGLDGRFVAPGPSGAPSRGRPEVLPTGRNFYSIDTRAVPTPAAWQLGWKSATRLIERHRQELGAWPKRLALSAWGTANMRTGGDDLAQALAFLGVKPTWDRASARVTGFEILPLSVLGRPRIDVTLRVSGFFRDAFPAQIDLIDSAARAVAQLDEPEAMNPLAARFARDVATLKKSGLEESAASRRAGFRVFGSKPGAYGAGLQALIDESGWEEEGDLARAYLAWGGYAYGNGAAGETAPELLQARLEDIEVVVHNQDNREHDLLDSDDYYQFEGGLAVAVRHLSGSAPRVYHNDHSRPESPAIRTLEEEVARVVRARVVNPKWIAGVMRHGYKGAFEMAATVDYLFAFAATARAVGDHHFDLVYAAYLEDPEVSDFLDRANPAAKREMAARLLEAERRRLWHPKANSTHRRLDAIAAGKQESLT